MHCRYMYRSIEEMDMLQSALWTITCDKLVDNAQYHEIIAFDEDRTVVGTTDCMMISNAWLDVRIWSISEGATQQQSGGVVFASGTSAWSVFKTWIELHQHENLKNYNDSVKRIAC